MIALSPTYAGVVIITIALTSIASILGLAVFHSRSRHAWLSSESMPSILRAASLALNEQELLDSEGNRIRVDQVFRTSAGKLIVLDTKTRKKHAIYSSDEKQIKKYAKALVEVYDQPVEKFAYIRTVVPVNNGAGRSIKYLKILL